MTNKIDTKTIAKLREATGAPVLRAKKVLDEVKGDFKMAEKVLRKEGFEKLAKREGRETKAGIVETYIHATKNSGATVVMGAETDFVSRNPDFVKLAHEVAMQGTATQTENIQALLKQPYIKDPKKTVGELIDESKVKFGENILIKDIKYFEV